MTNANAQTLRRILRDIQLGETFDKEERVLVLQILLELVEKVARLENECCKPPEVSADRLTVNSETDCNPIMVRASQQS